MPRVLLVITAICWLAANSAYCRDAPQGLVTIEMDPAPQAQVVTQGYISMVGPSASRTPEEAEAAATATPSDATVTPQQGALYQQILDLHNSYRAKHGVAALTWSATLATSSANYAKECKWKHSGWGPGENLYATSQRNAGATALADSVKAWYDEITDPRYDFSRPGYQPGTGHFTQIIWKGSTELGCAVKDCDMIEGAWPGTYVVCHYNPPGNVIGFFHENVFPVGGGSNPSPNPGGGGGVKYDPNTAIPAGRMLLPNKCIKSTNQQHRLCVLGTGDVQIQTLNPSTGRFRRTWNTNVRAPAGLVKPYYLGLFKDGNLAAFDKNYEIFWETGTAGVGVAPHVAVLRDTGNLILYDNTGKCIWSAKGNCARRRAATP